MPITRSALAAKRAASAQASKPEAPTYPPLPENFPFVTPAEIAFSKQETIPAKDVLLARLPRQDWALAIVRTVRALCDTVRENITIRSSKAPIVTKLLPKGREIKSDTSYEVCVAGITSGLDMARLIHVARELSEQFQIVPQPTSASKPEAPAELAARPAPNPAPKPAPKPEATKAPVQASKPKAPARMTEEQQIARRKADSAVINPPEPKSEFDTIRSAFLSLKSIFASKSIRGATITFKDDPKDPTICITGLKRPVALAHGLICDELPPTVEVVLLDEGEAEGSPKGTIWVELGLDLVEEDEAGEAEETDEPGEDPAPEVEAKGPVQRADEATLQAEYRAGKLPRFVPLRNKLARKWGCFDLETLTFERTKNAATEEKARELCELLNLPVVASPPETKPAIPNEAAPLPLSDEEMNARYVVQKNGQAQEWQVRDQERKSWVPDTGSKNREEVRHLARVLNAPAKSSKPQAPAPAEPKASTPPSPPATTEAAKPAKTATPPPAKTGPAPIRKADVKLEGRYRANISGKLTTVRITHVLTGNRGWDAVNEATGRNVHIKSAQKLRSEVKSNAKS